MLPKKEQEVRPSSQVLGNIVIVLVFILDALGNPTCS